MTQGLYRIICWVHALPWVVDGRDLAAVECSHRGFGANRPLFPLIRNLPHWWTETAFKFKSTRDEDFICLCSL